MNTQSHGQKETSKELAVGQVLAAWDCYVLRSFAKEQSRDFAHTKRLIDTAFN